MNAERLDLLARHGLAQPGGHLGHQVGIGEVGGGFDDGSCTPGGILALEDARTHEHRFGTQLQLNIQATDVDPETLTLQVTNLPAFGVFTPTGNGTGRITFNPAQSSGTGRRPVAAISCTRPIGATSCLAHP